MTEAGSLFTYENGKVFSNWEIPRQLLDAMTLANGSTATVATVRNFPFKLNRPDVPQPLRKVAVECLRLGYVDIVFTRNGGAPIGIECDRRRPRLKSIVKLRNFSRWCVVCRE